MRGLIATVMLLGLTGCVRLMGDDVVEPIDGGTAPQDSPHDRALTDHQVVPDRPWPDGPVPPPDGPAPQPDGPVQPPDGPVPLPDGPVQPPDGPVPKPDAPQSDGPLIYLDGPLPKPDKGGSVCTPGTIATSVGFKAVLCVSSTLSYNQCNAHNLCNKSTANLCTATQYQNRIKSGISTAAWIAGCVRSGATPFAPKSAACSDCISFSTTNAFVEWPCTTKVVGIQSTDSHLGLVAHNDCRQVGANLSSTEGFWKTSPTGTKLSASICCY